MGRRRYPVQDGRRCRRHPSRPRGWKGSSSSSQAARRRAAPSLSPGSGAEAVARGPWPGSSGSWGLGLHTAKSPGSIARSPVRQRSCSGAFVIDLSHGGVEERRQFAAPYRVGDGRGGEVVEFDRLRGELVGIPVEVLTRDRVRPCVDACLAQVVLRPSRPERSPAWPAPPGRRGARPPRAGGAQEAAVRRGGHESRSGPVGCR